MIENMERVVLRLFAPICDRPPLEVFPGKLTYFTAVNTFLPHIIHSSRSFSSPHRECGLNS